MSVDIQNPDPLYIQIVNDIKSKIKIGDLAVGTKIPSQNELAAQYGVSLITVKKALNDLNKDGIIFSKAGKGSFVSNRVNHVDYKKLQTVGFVLRDLESPFFSRILSSAERMLSSEKYNLLLSSSAGRADKEDNLIQHFLDIGVNGLIIAAMSREYIASPIIRKLHNENFPYVVVSYMADEDISFVGVDNELGAYMATDHLIKLGYTKLGYLNGTHGEGVSLLGELRKKGFQRALAENGIEYKSSFEFKFQLGGEWNDYQSGYDIGLKFLEYSFKPEAIFAFDDLSALGFQKAMLDNGLKVPDDIAIVGFDDIRRGVTAPVPLTTIHQPLSEIGEIAVDIIIKKITGQPVNGRKILKPSLIVRESCGAKLLPKK